MLRPCKDPTVLPVSLTSFRKMPFWCSVLCANYPWNPSLMDPQTQSAWCFGFFFLFFVTIPLNTYNFYNDSLKVWPYLSWRFWLVTSKHEDIFRTWPVTSWHPYLESSCMIVVFTVIQNMQPKSSALVLCTVFQKKVLASFIVLHLSLQRLTCSIPFCCGSVVSSYCNIRPWTSHCE